MNQPRSSTQISLYHKGYLVTANPPEKSSLPEVMQVDYYLEKDRRESLANSSDECLFFKTIIDAPAMTNYIELIETQ